MGRGGAGEAGEEPPPADSDRESDSESDSEPEEEDEEDDEEEDEEEVEEGDEGRRSRRHILLKRSSFSRW